MANPILQNSIGRKFHLFVLSWVHPAVLLMLLILIQCSDQGTNLTFESPISLKTIDHLDILQDSSGDFTLSFVNPYYNDSIPPNVDSSLFYFLVLRNRLITGKNPEEVWRPLWKIPVLNHSGDSLITIPEYLPGGISILQQGFMEFSACVGYGYLQGSLCTPVSFPDSQEYYSVFLKQLISNLSCPPTYKVNIYSYDPVPELPQVISEVTDYIQAISSGKMVFTGEPVSLDFPEVTRSSILMKAESLEATGAIDDVCYILPYRFSQELHSRYVVPPRAYASGRYFLIYEKPTLYLFIHEMLHNFNWFWFNDLYNGYSPAQYPYVNSLPGTVYGDNPTMYMPKFIRGHLGWDTLLIERISRGETRELIVKAVTAENKESNLAFLGLDSNGFFRFVSFELFTGTTPDRGWQNPGLRVFEYFTRIDGRPDHIHLFPLDPAGESAPVHDKIFALEMKATLDLYGVLPRWYRSATQRGLTISVLDQYGLFDSMKISISLE